jgi:hypothetical protein
LHHHIDDDHPLAQLNGQVGLESEERRSGSAFAGKSGNAEDVAVRSKRREGRGV